MTIARRGATFAFLDLLVAIGREVLPHAQDEARTADTAGPQKATVSS